MHSLSLSVSAVCILNRTLTRRINSVQGHRAESLCPPVLLNVPIELGNDNCWGIKQTVRAAPVKAAAPGTQSVPMAHQRHAVKERQLKTYFKTALSPCLTVMLSFKTESPLRAGTPAGTRNNSLSPRTTRHFPGIAKSPQIPMFLVLLLLFFFLSPRNFHRKT